MTRTTSRAALLAASVIGLGAFSGTYTANAGPEPRVNELRTLRGSDDSTSRSIEKQSPSRLGEGNSIAKAMFGGFGSYKPARYPNGPGWTHAHVQRMARKRRNKAKNKRAHRG